MLKKVAPQASRVAALHRAKTARNPPLHEAAAADEALGEAYRSLVDLKLGFDSWYEIHPRAQGLYDEIMKAIDSVAEARKDTYQVRMMVQRKKYGSAKAAMNYAVAVELALSAMQNDLERLERHLPTIQRESHPWGKAVLSAIGHMKQAIRALRSVVPD